MTLLDALDPRKRAAQTYAEACQTMIRTYDTVAKTIQDKPFLHTWKEPRGSADYTFLHAAQVEAREHQSSNLVVRAATLDPKGQVELWVSHIDIAPDTTIGVIKTAHIDITSAQIMAYKIDWQTFTPPDRCFFSVTQLDARLIAIKTARSILQTHPIIMAQSHAARF